MTALWDIAFSWLPPVFQVAVLAFLALLVIILIFKLVSLVLSAIPFL